MATNLFSPAGDKGVESWCREPEDGHLLALAKSGQTAAFAELCRSYAKKNLRTTYHITKNQEDAEDAVQDAFCISSILRSGQAFRHGSSRIAINSALMISRRRRNFSEIPAKDSGAVGWSQEIADSDPNPEKHYLAQERERLVQRAIRSLRPDIRVVLEMQHLQDYSVEEIARVMGISVGTDKLRLFHGRKAQRRAPSLRSIGGSKFIARSLTGDA